jgi:hypothetical protein
MLLEILVVLEVQCRERQFIGEAASCDPHVVDRTRPSAADSRCRQASPNGGHRFITGVEQC